MFSFSESPHPGDCGGGGMSSGAKGYQQAFVKDGVVQMSLLLRPGQ